VLFQHVAAASEGYSGSDLHLLCKEAAMRPLRRRMAELALGQAEEQGQGKHAAADKQPQVIHCWTGHGSLPRAYQATETWHSCLAAAACLLAASACR
jgi:SpoVK/Ycf46/Vps4 family AAA+-type ATPase